PPLHTSLYALSLHDALPISADLLLEPGESRVEVLVCSKRTEGRIKALGARIGHMLSVRVVHRPEVAYPVLRWLRCCLRHGLRRVDRKSTRLNSSHSQISYAV